jgi:hypothetical protein
MPSAIAMSRDAAEGSAPGNAEALASPRSQPVRGRGARQAISSG